MTVIVCCLWVAAGFSLAVVCRRWLLNLVILCLYWTMWLVLLCKHPSCRDVVMTFHLRNPSGRFKLRERFYRDNHDGCRLYTDAKEEK